MLVVLYVSKSRNRPVGWFGEYYCLPRRVRVSGLLNFSKCSWARVVFFFFFFFLDFYNIDGKIEDVYACKVLFLQKMSRFK